MAENTPHVQAKFVTKQNQYAIPDTPYSVPSTVEITDLVSLINTILQESDAGQGGVEFDFLIEGEFLRTSLDKHLENKGISPETVVEIEYVERHPAPKPEDSLLHDDWVSCVHGHIEHILTGSYDNTIRLWTTDGEAVMTIPGHSAPVKTVAWISHEKNEVRFISGSHDQTVLIWQWNTDSNEVDCMYSCRGHAGSVDSVAVDSTGTKFCSGSWDKMLKLWVTEITPDKKEPEDEGEKPQKRKKTSGQKVQTRVPLLTLSGHSEGISAVQWTDLSEVCTASWDHTIKLWDMEQATEKKTLQGSKVFFDISYSPLNHTLVSASADRFVRLWDPRSKDGAVVKCTYISHTAWVSSVEWSPTNSNQFVSGSHDKVMKLWDTRSPKAPLYDMAGHEDKILAVDWSIPQLLLSGGADNHLKLFRYEDLQSRDR
ncbi:hypothetical protein ScPMuIL_015035 [Solemya velum]